MKIIYTVVGFIFLGLGLIGIALPILPTTPFLLVSAFCFARSSKKVEKWFISSTIYKNHLESFVTHRAMTLKSKIIILTFASVMLMFPLVFSDNIYLRIVIILLYICKYSYFIFAIETINKT